MPRERITLESEVVKIMKKIGQKKARDWIIENFGVANFSKLDNASLERFVLAHAEEASEHVS